MSTDAGPLSLQGEVIAALPADGCPPVNAKRTFTAPDPGAAWTTNFCETLWPAATAPTCHVPCRSPGPVPASAPEPDPAEYITTPSRGAVTARPRLILPAPSPSGPTYG